MNRYLNPGSHLSHSFSITRGYEHCCITESLFQPLLHWVGICVTGFVVGCPASDLSEALWTISCRIYVMRELS